MLAEEISCNKHRKRKVLQGLAREMLSCLDFEQPGHQTNGPNHMRRKALGKLMARYR